MATYRSSSPSSRSSGTSCSLEVVRTSRRNSLSSETMRSAAAGLLAINAMALLRALKRKCGLSWSLRVSSSAWTSLVTTRWRSVDSLLASCTRGDRKSTRLNSSHQIRSYAVFCLKKKREREGREGGGLGGGWRVGGGGGGGG